MINLVGDWSIEKPKIDKAIELASNTLAEITGLAPNIAFDLLFPEITFEIAPDVGGIYHEYVSALTPTTIEFDADKVSYRLALHGMGHVIILTDKIFNPADWLSRNVIRTEFGRAVTGAGRYRYSRSMGYHNSKYTGYYSIYYPEHQHPRDLDEKGNTSTEDFCDMFLSLADGNILDNDSGKAIKKWITEYLRRRILYAYKS